AVDRDGRLQTVGGAHLDVRDHQVRPGGAAQIDKLCPVLGQRDPVAHPGQQLLEVLAHVELVVGGDDVQRAVHGRVRGKVMTISAPGPVPSPTAISPPWDSTIRFAIAMPRPVPFALVVKNGSKMLRRCSGVRPGPWSRTATRTAGRPASAAAEQAT